MRLTITIPFILLAALHFSSCCKTYENSDPYINIKPKGPRPLWAPGITPQMQKFIEKLDSFAIPPLYTLTPQQARQQPSVADVVLSVMQEYGISYPPMYIYTDTTGRDIPVSGGQLHLRIYTPKTGKTYYPVIVYYHGGGWVMGDPDTYHISARALSEQTEAIVVSVAYRRAPGYIFPVAHNDAFTAYKWVLKNAAAIKGDSAKVAVAGEDAGGNLAAAVSIMARDSGSNMPRHQLLIYPIAGHDMNTPSYLQYADAKPLGKPLMEWLFSQYAPANKPVAWISLVNANLQQLPPATIIAAELDPLQSEGRQLSERLQSAGVPVTYRLYAGVTHDFFGMAKILPEARDAQHLAATQLKKAFEK